MVKENSEPAIGRPKSQQQQEQNSIDQMRSGLRDMLEPSIKLNARHNISPPPEVAASTDPLIESQKQNLDWHIITEHVTMNFKGRRQSFNDIIKYIYRVCEIGTYSDLTSIRQKEEKVGNLIADIYIQKAKAQYALGKLEGQRLSRLGLFIEAKDRRYVTAIDARLCATDDGYKAIMSLHSDCKSTLEFWLDMYNICLRTTDRLKQISMTLMAEMKLEPSDQGGKGHRVAGS